MADEANDRDREQIDRDMKQREEDDRQARERERRDQELRADERRERERFRERERDRDYERERDRNRVRRVEREREREEPGPYWAPANVKYDLSRLAYASARATTDVAVGVTRVFGSLLGNLMDTFAPGGPGQRERYRSADDPDRDYDRDRGYGSPRRRTWNAAEDVRSAVRETADVVARSGEDFSRYYDRSLYDDEEERRERPSRRDERERPPREPDR